MVKRRISPTTGIRHDRIAELRHGRTQEQLAKEMNRRGFDWSRVTVTDIEAGRRDLRFAEGLALAAALNVDPSQLVVEPSAPHQPWGLSPHQESQLSKLLSLKYGTSDVMSHDNDSKRVRRHITDDLLRQVADIYQSADDGRPTLMVQQRLGTSHRSAARYVHLARQRGYLQPVQDQLGV